MICKTCHQEVPEPISYRRAPTKELEPEISRKEQFNNLLKRCLEFMKHNRAATIIAIAMLLLVAPAISLLFAQLFSAPLWLVAGLKSTIVGGLSFCTLAGGLWLLFPGAYYLGMFVSHKLLDWQIGNINDGPGGWLFGIVLLSLLPLSYYVGSLIFPHLF